jgi:hypothetical protein
LHAKVVAHQLNSWAVSQAGQGKTRSQTRALDIAGHDRDSINSATATLHIAAGQQKRSGFTPTLLALLEAGLPLRFLLIALREKNLIILASFFSGP